MSSWWKRYGRSGVPVILQRLTIFPSGWPEVDSDKPDRVILAWMGCYRAPTSGWQCPDFLGVRAVRQHIGLCGRRWREEERRMSRGGVRGPTPIGKTTNKKTIA
ncbi:unnamed protein product [Prorocentrum cordatum]|uniref:Uncharacterized protein n=1 Tax=Prorocentrum cordatum TaxID=2364126 RepID=A0ABN9Q595_9DINO|nr:unnamed protein product [Polarella glacialis]